MKRREVFAGLAAALALPLAKTIRAQSAVPAKCIQTTYDLIPPEPRGWSATGQNGYTFSVQPGWYTTDYTLPGSAATASTRAWHGDLAQLPVVRAFWRLVWNPLGNPAAGAQLSHVADGFVDYRTLFAFDGHSEVTPIHSSMDITPQIQTLQAMRTRRFLVHRLKGQPIVFASLLEVIWSLD